jgi:hypothetical protein
LRPRCEVSNLFSVKSSLLRSTPLLAAIVLIAACEAGSPGSLPDDPLAADDAIAADAEASAAATTPLASAPAYSILRAGNRFVGGLGDRYLDEVQPALSRRCAVCHSCTNGPCQLNMTSFAALERGLSKTNPYKWGVTDGYPTRVSDNRPLSHWREKGFVSVLPEGGADPASSVFFQALALGDKNTASDDPNSGPLKASTVRPMAQKQDEGNLSCPTSGVEFLLHELANPQGGMPWGLPADGEDHATLEAWALDGAPGPSATARARVAAPQTSSATRTQPATIIARWEAFFNGDALRDQLVARYLYEHVYSANIHFTENPGEFYRLVRSRTKAPAAIDLIHTDMPQEDPGTARVYYRLEKIDRVIEGKTHVPWAVSFADLARLQELFLSGTWTVDALPAYTLNPFEVFAAIPTAARARFMIENSQMLFAGFARGPICLVQPASYAVDEHFWIWFVKPESDPTVLDPQLGLDSWDSFFTKDGLPTSGLPLGDKYGEPIYRDAFEKTLRRVKPGGLGLQDVWTGGGTDPDAWLTVHRNQISVDVHTTKERPVTGMPRSVWLITYANFERMFYNATAQYKYWGSLVHQKTSFSWQTYTRTEAEDLYTSLFPDQWYREQLRDRMTSLQGKIYNSLFTDYAKGRPSASPQYRTEDALARAFIGALGSAMGPEDRLNNWPTVRTSVIAPSISTVAQWESGVRTVTNRVLPFGQFFPNVVHVRLGGQHLYTFLAVRGLRPDKISSLEATARERARDYVVAVPGFSAFEAHMFVDLAFADASAFLTELSAVRDQASWNRFADRYKVGRNSPHFWPFVDWMHDWLGQNLPVRAGLLELRAYDKDEKPF